MEDQEKKEPAFGSLQDLFDAIMKGFDRLDAQERNTGFERIIVEAAFTKCCFENHSQKVANGVLTVFEVLCKNFPGKKKPSGPDPFEPAFLYSLRSIPYPKDELTAMKVMTSPAYWDQTVKDLLKNSKLQESGSEPVAKQLVQLLNEIVQDKTDKIGNAYRAYNPEWNTKANIQLMYKTYNEMLAWVLDGGIEGRLTYLENLLLVFRFALKHYSHSDEFKPA